MTGSMASTFGNNLVDSFEVEEDRISAVDRERL